jgi:membrane associated rhomboid family serine protease
MNLNLTGVVKNLIILNILAYIVTVYLIPNLWVDLAVYYPETESFKPYQIITYMFLHDPGGISHLFFNMFGLFMFGPPVEYMWGPKRFLIYYIVCGIGALILHFGIDFYQVHFLNVPVEVVEIPLMGASGAIFGLLAAYGMLFPNNMIMLMFPPIPMKAKYFVLIYGVIELFAGINNTDNVAHFAHLGGALFGFLLIMYWRNGGTLGRD